MLKGVTDTLANPVKAHDYVTPAMARWRAVTDVPLLVLAIGSLPLLMLEFIREDLTRADRITLDVINLVVLVAFALDYLFELAVASNRRSYAQHEWPSLLIVVAQALAVLPALAGFGVLRVLRAGRAWRGLATGFRAFAAGSVMAREGRAALRRHAASLALGVAGFTWITSAVAFTLAEDVGEGHRIDSFYDALWWSSATITTVGYGDVFPVTTVGRLVGVVTMVVGISTFAVVTAKVAQFLVLDGGPLPEEDVRSQ
jgi:voltage-gated potassium channel